MSSSKTFSVIFYLLAIVALFGVIASCRQAGNTRATATFYDSPIGSTLSKRRNTLKPRKLLSNLGEFRGASGDGPTWFNHGATDFVAPRNTNVYSPDKGEVKFFGGGATNSGTPPVKIGHFAFLHFHNATRLPMDPNTLGDRSVRTFIVDPDDPIWVLVQGRPRQTTLRGNASVEGVKEEPPGSGNWKKVFWYNRRSAIGQTTGPDLHMIYYSDPAVDYNNRGSIRNALSVMRYENSVKAKFGKFRLFAEKAQNSAGNKKFIADNDQNRRGDMSIPDDAGVDIVIGASSFGQSKNNRAGIYKLSYSIYRILQPGDPFVGTIITGAGGRRLGEVRADEVMHTYDSLLPTAKDQQLVAYPPTRVPPDGPASLFGNANPGQNKYTSYVVSNSNGNDSKHWELENIGIYPDGEYVVRIKAWNINRSGGIGNVPVLNDAILDVIVSIETDLGNQIRMLWVRNP